MTSLEYAEEVNISHSNILRKIKKYIAELKKIGVNSEDYFVETFYLRTNTIRKHRMYNITDKGLEMLNANICSTKMDRYCHKNNNTNVLPEWVVNNLRTYGNCSIAHRRVKKYGEERILSGLLSCGLDCDINIYDKTYTYFTNIGMVDYKEKFCILTVKR